MIEHSSNYNGNRQSQQPELFACISKHVLQWNAL
jgi:hypothetical protein